MTEIQTSGYLDDMKDILDVNLKWVTPNADYEIGHMARVSNPAAKIDDPADRLIAYLLRKHHWSPFQMANMCVEVHTTRDISAQILRHASMAFQEFSTRYAAVEELEKTKECRFQDTTNRQNSFTIEYIRENGYYDPDVVARLDDTKQWWDYQIRNHAESSELIYAEALRRGIAKECARVFLPIGLCPTTMYINGTIRSWIHYIALRNDPATQKEHRVIAAGAYDLLRANLPNTTMAFDAWHRTNQIKERLYTLIMNADDQETIDFLSDAIYDSYDQDVTTPDIAKNVLRLIVKEVSGG